MICTSEVPQGRPAPWMIFRLMERLDVYPPHAVLKIGDTAPDIAEGRNAGVWTAGVTATGSEVGLSADDLAALSPAEREARLAAAAEKLFAQAHFVIDSVADLPSHLPVFENCVRETLRPSR
jgi:phosphonoacetaldehyde hydrolase